MTSLCLGLARKMTPNRSWSYRGVDTCIISTAQQASPNVIGQIDPCRAQFTTYFHQPSTVKGNYRICRCQNIIHHTFLRLLPLEGGWLSGTCDRWYCGIFPVENRESCSSKFTWHCTNTSGTTFEIIDSLRFARDIGIRLVRRAMVTKQATRHSLGRSGEGTGLGPLQISKFTGEFSCRYFSSSKICCWPFRSPSRVFIRIRLQAIDLSRFLISSVLSFPFSHPPFSPHTPNRFNYQLMQSMLLLAQLNGMKRRTSHPQVFLYILA
jgi:hypothetical protein